jgi:WD40 repeat protein
MHRFAVLHVCVFTTVAVMAAPAPQRRVPPPITAANVKTLHSIHEIGVDAWEVVWGPKRGELALLSWAKPASVLDATTYKLLREVGAKRGLIHVAFGPSGDTLAWCENNTRVEVQDLKTKATLVLETGNAQSRMVFSPDGKLLATGGYGTQAKLWDVATGKLVRDLDAGGVAGGLTTAFSPDGKWIAVGNRNHTTHLFEVKTGKPLHELPRRMSHELKFSPDGKTLAVAYVNGEVALWDASTGRLLQVRATGAAEVYTLDWGKKGDVLATAGRNGKIIMWKAADLTLLKELEAPKWVIRVRFSPDGDRLLTAGGGIQSDSGRKVVVWGIERK